MDVSRPDSPNFGKHWPSKQVAEVFAPSDITVASVVEWLTEAGISSDRVRQSQGLNWVHAGLTVEEAERLLKTKYYEYVHNMTGQTHIACDSYSMPDEIQKHVDFITPTVHFDTSVRATKKRRKVNNHEIQSVKRHASTVGHKVEPGIAHSVSGSGDGSLPKQGYSIFPGNVLNELDSCDTLTSPDCLRALYSTYFWRI
jgi:tripeptidyl-peptidase I